MIDTNETIVDVYLVDAHVWLKWKYGLSDVYIVTETELNGIKPNANNHCTYCVNKSQNIIQMGWAHSRFVINWFYFDCVQQFSAVESIENYEDSPLSVDAQNQYSSHW